MICLGEVLDQAIYRERIAIIEDKHEIMRTFGLEKEDWLQLWNIDNRILTLCYHSLDPAFDRFIVVYDYSYFCEDQEMKEAIIWHEIGHAEFPVTEGNIDLYSEKKCDELAFHKGYKAGLEAFLNLTYKMAKTLNNQLLINMTDERLKALRLLMS
ncbi:hypothetical protein SAMN04488137_2689 [Fictibacillus solisalsi]|uniref:Uncharacterized protein n=1 Tax=Fictibacillus solisalsi TaxID=459525 RepID=A0A1G9XBF0_9BACL|nr:hypothetical protein [Fictibacillus solisalsi]SDM94064.1 hypothetical protein SAMN04488137_2689 [Fictibacillus solisalsi]